MPTLAELRNRIVNDREFDSVLPAADEVLVADVRSRLTPAQIVEQKLRTLLRPKTSTGMRASGGYRPRKAK